MKTAGTEIRSAMPRAQRRRHAPPAALIHRLPRRRIALRPTQRTLDVAMGRGQLACGKAASRSTEQPASRPIRSRFTRERRRIAANPATWRAAAKISIAAAAGVASMRAKNPGWTSSANRAAPLGIATTSRPVKRACAVAERASSLGAILLRSALSEASQQRRQVAAGKPLALQRRPRRHRPVVSEGASACPKCVDRRGSQLELGADSCQLDRRRHHRAKPPRRREAPAANDPPLASRRPPPRSRAVPVSTASPVRVRPRPPPSRRRPLRLTARASRSLGPAEQQSRRPAPPPLPEQPSRRRSDRDGGSPHGRPGPRARQRVADPLGQQPAWRALPRGSPERPARRLPLHPGAVTGQAPSVIGVSAAPSVRVAGPPAAPNHLGDLGHDPPAIRHGARGERSARSRARAARGSRRAAARLPPSAPGSRAGAAHRRASLRAPSRALPGDRCSSAVSRSSASGPRTSPITIRSGRMRSALRSRSRIVTSPAALDARGAALEAHDVWLLQPQLGRVLDRHHPSRAGDECARARSAASSCPSRSRR